MIRLRGGPGETPRGFTFSGTADELDSRQDRRRTPRAAVLSPAPESACVTTADAIAAPRAATPARLSGRAVQRLQNGQLRLLGFSGAVVFIEPSPYEAMFVLAAGGFLLTGGLALRPSSAVLLLAGLAFNLGGLFSLTPFLDETASVTFVATSFYLGITSLFFAALMAERAVERLDALKGGLTWAAAVASIAGILGY